MNEASGGTKESQTRKGAGPLDGIRVLDLSRIMAGPWATQILADLGADVVKVERPGAGDDTRSWGPPFLKDEAGNNSGNSGYFLCVNRGKRSITVDIATPEGQELIRKLAKNSDVLLENYKVGGLAKFGLAYEDLKKINPGLVYASVTGFGQTGPRAKQSAYDFMIQAMGGLMSVTGEADGLPGGGPQKVGVPIVDLMTGMYAAIAVLAALVNRNESGQGDHVDIGMLDVQTAFLANQAMNYLLTGKEPVRRGNKHPNIQPQNVYACRNGYIAVAVGNDAQFERFAGKLGMPELATDDRFHRNASRVTNLDALEERITARLREEDVAFWVDRFDAVGVPCSPINTLSGLFADVQVQHRGMLQYLKHPLADALPQVVSPIKLKRSALTFEKAPPLLSEHTDEILMELGLSQEDIQSLRDTQIV